MEKILTYVIIAIAGIVILSALLWPVGSANDQAHDEQLSSDLQSVTTAIRAYEAANARLPESLNDLEDELDDSVDIGRIEYYTEDVPEDYQLCATFKTESSSDSTTYRYSFAEVNVYEHDKGRVCFDFESSRSWRGSSSGGFDSSQFDGQEFESLFDDFQFQEL